MYSFSTIARDALDQFTDKEIVRTTKIIDERTRPVPVAAESRSDRTPPFEE
jgi:hypothetical protein